MSTSAFDVGEYLNEDEVYALTEEPLYEPSDEPSLDQSQDSKPDFRMNKLMQECMDPSGIEPPRSMMPKMTTQTGPKGVLNDYRIACNNQRNINMRARIAAERAIDRTINQTTSIHLQNDIDAQDRQSIKQAIKHANSQSTSQLSDDEDSEDEEFADFVQSRLSLMQSAKQTFGTYDRIESRKAFAAELDAINQSVNQSEAPTCVVHIYDNSVELCARLHFAFQELCTQFDDVRFVRLRREDGFDAFPVVGLPALLVYRGRELVHSALRVGEALGATPSDSDVAKLLQAVGALKQRAPIAALKNEYDRLNQREQPSKQAIRSNRPTAALSSDESDNDSD